MYRLFSTVIWLFCTVLIAVPFSHAQDGPRVSEIFKDMELNPVFGKFLVMKAINVRATPETGGAKLGTLTKGQTVHAVGRAPKTQWLAVRKDGTDLGFVYAPMLVRVIDGKIERPIVGFIEDKTRFSCRFEIRFEEKSDVEGTNLITSDYWTSLDCMRPDGHLTRELFMFLTETPYHPNHPGVFQISVEMNDVGEDYDEALAAVTLFNFDEGTVEMSGISPKSYMRKEKETSRKARDVETALSAALELTLHSWSDKAWEAAKNR